MTLRFVIVFCMVAAAGCAAVRTTPETPTAPAAATPEPQAPALSDLTPDATLAEEPMLRTPESNQAPAATHPTPAAPKPEPPSQRVANPRTGPDHPAVAEAPDSPPAHIALQPSADTLDFAALGARLRTTKAIGALTKLSVKNQADELLEQFRGYYQRRGTATLPDLRRSYDTLVVKLLSLLQDGDPPLATDIDRSRDAIWDILSDQRKFVDSHLMAGTSP